MQSQHYAALRLTTAAFRRNLSVFQHVNIYLSEFMIVGLPRDRRQTRAHREDVSLQTHSKHSMNGKARDTTFC